MGEVLSGQGDYAQAAELMQAAVEYEREIGHPDVEQHAEVVAQLRARSSLERAVGQA